MNKVIGSEKTQALILVLFIQDISHDMVEALKCNTFYFRLSQLLTMSVIDSLASFHKFCSIRGILGRYWLVCHSSNQTICQVKFCISLPFSPHS